MTTCTRRCWLMLLSAAPLTFLSCGSSQIQAPTYPVGQKVQVGKIVYQVIEAQWASDAPGSRQPPKNRILQMHLTVINSSGQETTMPFLRLIDAAGNEILELTEIEGNSRWLGSLRRLRPTVMEEGSIYFDVPVGAYRLELVDQTVPDAEKTAYVSIPASLAPPPSLPSPESK